METDIRPDLHPNFWPSYVEPSPMATAIQYPLSDSLWQDRVLSAYARRNKIASETFTLEWEAAARPPIHPNPMLGKQSFKTAEEARRFFYKQANDSRFISLIKITTIHEDIPIKF